MAGRLRLIETRPTQNWSTATLSTGKIASEPLMPPMTLKGIVTKVGVMKKTATVTVSRWVIQKQTGKVCTASRFPLPVCCVLTKGHFQRIERSKKYLTHDENGGVLHFRY